MADLYEFIVEWPSTSARTVIVTGDFDKWSKSLPLLRSSASNQFTGTIKVPYGCPTRYKFIVDGEWKVKRGEPTELSPEGYLNNICYVPLKEPLEDITRPKHSIDENRTSFPAGNGNTGAGVDTGNDNVNVTVGQAIKDSTIASKVGIETPPSHSSSQPPLPMDTQVPATTELPTTPPTEDAITNQESDIAQTPDIAIAPLIPIPIIPVNARENCTIDPTKVISNEDSIGTFVGIKPPLKEDEEKAGEEEEKGEGDVTHPPESSVTSPPVTEAPVEPSTEVVKPEPALDVAPVQEEAPMPAPKEVVVTETAPVQENTSTSAPEEAKEEPKSAALPVQEKAPVPAPEPTTEGIKVKTEEGALKSMEPKKEEEPKPEASSGTPTADTQDPPKSPSKFIEGANGHAKTASDTSTPVKPTSSPTTSSTAPGTTLAESITSGSSAPGNKKITSEPERKSSAGDANGGDAKEFGVKGGKGSTKNRKRKSSIFGSLRKLFHGEKNKKTNGSA